LQDICAAKSFFFFFSDGLLVAIAIWSWNITTQRLSFPLLWVPCGGLYWQSVNVQFNFSAWQGNSVDANGQLHPIQLVFSASILLNWLG